MIAVIYYRTVLAITNTHGCQCIASRVAALKRNPIQDNRKLRSKAAAVYDQILTVERKAISPRRHTTAAVSFGDELVLR